MKTPAGLCALVLLDHLHTIQQEARTIVANALAGALR